MIQLCGALPSQKDISRPAWLVGEAPCNVVWMTGVTQILASIERGDPCAAEQLLPLVYDELRKLATAKLAQERPGQTLQATALVHEAYLRLVGEGGGLSGGQPLC